MTTASVDFFRGGPSGQGPRIAYVTTHFPRVALTFITNEVDALERRGARIDVFAVNRPDAPDLASGDARKRAERTTYLKTSWLALFMGFGGLLLRRPFRTLNLLELAIRSARLDLGLIVRRISHLLQAAKLARACHERGIRHLHAHFGQAPATIAWFAAEILNFGRPAERATWSFTIHGFQDFVDEAVARLDLKAASAAFVVCVSDFTRSQLCRVSDPQHWDRFHVVRCGIDLRLFEQRTALPNNLPPVAINVGRLSAEKGQLPLLHAVGLLKARGVHVNLVLIGSGPLESHLRSEIDRLELQDRVKLTGELQPDEVNRRLREADMFCIASFAEGLPVSMMEAMAVGVPVIASAIAGIPELAVNGETAITVPAGSIEALADAMEALVGDGDLRKRLPIAARARVEQMHDLDRNADELLALLRARAGASA